jgi:hypothetical protein
MSEYDRKRYIAYIKLAQKLAHEEMEKKIKNTPHKKKGKSSTMGSYEDIPGFVSKIPNREEFEKILQFRKREREAAKLKTKVNKK